MPREREVMLRTASGRLNKQIAAELRLSLVTVKVHRGQVMRKMLARSVVDLARIADQLGVSRATLAIPRSKSGTLRWNGRRLARGLGCRFKSQEAQCPRGR